MKMRAPRTSLLGVALCGTIAASTLAAPGALAADDPTGGPTTTTTTTPSTTPPADVPATAPASTVPSGAPATGAPTAGTKRGTGLDLSKVPTATEQSFAIVGNPQGNQTRRSAKALAAPSSFSLESSAPRAGDQRNTNGCVTWAVGYTSYGTLMSQQGISGAPMAPMYLYSQIARGRDNGTFGEVALDLAVDQGVATRSSYWQGDYDYTTQPTQEQRQVAAKYKLSGYQTIPVSSYQTKQRIMDAVSSGMPVAVGMIIYENLYNLRSYDARSYGYRPSGNQLGGHEMTVIGYDQKGVRIQNSWGPSWGDNGRMWLSWDYFLNSGDLKEANAVGKLVSGGGDRYPAPSPSSTYPSPSSSTTSRPSPTSTSRPEPSPRAYYYYWGGHYWYFDGYRSWMVW